ncbi:MAG: hypothetical protein J6T45_00930 [Fibrobacterales bacterium]|nr:hypothetical protein [Fibrobacterales bacterium]
MKYAVRPFVNEGKTEEILFDFIPPNEVLSCFLVADFGFSPETYIAAINAVLDGKSEKEDLDGNDTNVVFGPEKTTIESLWTEEQGAPAPCVVNTRELRQVMDEWLSYHNRIMAERTHKPQDGGPAAEGKGETR